MHPDPIQRLVAEHDVITIALDAVAARIEAERGGAPFDPAFYERSFEFFKVFADGWHHAKEEKELFPLLETLGIPRERGPIGCLIEEHDAGRARVAAVRAALERHGSGDARAAEEVRGNATEFVALLREHIKKENGPLFRMADQVITPEDRVRLSERFDAAEVRIGGEPAQRKYASEARRLADDAGLPR